MDLPLPVPAGWGVPNQAFLQALMARGSMTLEEARPVLSAILSQVPGDDGQPGDEISPETFSEEDVDGLMSLAHEALMPLDYDIKKTRHQTTKEIVWAFVNLESDPAAQLATVYSADEIAFINRLLNAIFDTYNTPRMELMCVTEDQALKLSRPARSRESNGVGNNDDANGEGAQAAEKALKHSEVIDLLAALVVDGWLEKSARGFFSLTPRTLLELQTWIIESFDDDQDLEEGEWRRIKNCEACKAIVTVGQRCAEPNCSARLHDICEGAYWRTQRNRNCPKCKTPWTGKNLVGEKAVTETAAYKRRTGKSAAGRRSGVVQSIIDEAENEDVDGVAITEELEEADEDGEDDDG